jgi:hypothetical protein
VQHHFTPCFVALFLEYLKDSKRINSLPRSLNITSIFTSPLVSFTVKTNHNFEKLDIYNRTFMVGNRHFRIKYPFPNDIQQFRRPAAIRPLPLQVQFQFRRNTALHVQVKYDHGRNPATPVSSEPSTTRRHGNFAGVHTLLWILLSSNSAVLINIITGVSPPHFDFVVFYYVLCQC